MKGSCRRTIQYLPSADSCSAADVKPANFVLKLHHSRPLRALETGRGLQGSWLKAIDFGKPVQPGRQSSRAALCPCVDLPAQCTPLVWPAVHEQISADHTGPAPVTILSALTAFACCRLQSGGGRPAVDEAYWHASLHGARAVSAPVLLPCRPVELRHDAVPAGLRSLPLLVRPQLLHRTPRSALASLCMLARRSPGCQSCSSRCKSRGLCLSWMYLRLTLGPVCPGPPLSELCCPCRRDLAQCQEATLEEVIEAVTTHPVRVHDAPWLHLSPRGQDFMASLLQRDPGSRLTAGQALRHPWFREQLGPSWAAIQPQEASCVQLAGKDCTSSVDAAVWQAAQHVALRFFL